MYLREEVLRVACTSFVRHLGFSCLPVSPGSVPRCCHRSVLEAELGFPARNRSSVPGPSLRLACVSGDCFPAQFPLKYRQGPDGS